jgi:hypothetical protein
MDRAFSSTYSRGVLSQMQSRIKNHQTASSAGARSEPTARVLPAERCEDYDETLPAGIRYRLVQLSS